VPRKIPAKKDLNQEMSVSHQLTEKVRKEIGRKSRPFYGIPMGYKYGSYVLRRHLNLNSIANKMELKEKILMLKY